MKGLYCWFAVESTGEEGIAGVNVNGAWHPLFYGDHSMEKKAEAFAREIMRETGKKMVLKHFSGATVVKTIEQSKIF